MTIVPGDTGRPLPTVWSWILACTVAATTVWALRGMIDHGFIADDFSLLVANRDLGADGFLRFLFAADYGERPWVYWRPAWVLTWWGLHGACGDDPRAYHAFALALHTVHVLVLWFVARAVSGSPWLAAGAALLFALHGSHAEAVVWVAAATNVIPAATLLLVAAWLVSPNAPNAPSVGSARIAVACAFAALSLLWKEAAYGFPIVLAAAWLIGRTPGRWSPRDTRFATAVVVFASVIAWHYCCRNRMPGLAGSPFAILHVLASSIAACVRQLLPVPGGDVPVAIGAVAALAVLFVLLRASGRFWVLATIAGTLPYIVTTSGGRFVYFWHGPLAVLLAAIAARAVPAGSPWWRHVAGAAVLLVPLAFAPVGIGDELARFRREGEEARQLVSRLVDDGLVVGDSLQTDVMPASLVNGFDAALELATGRRVRVESFQVLPRPPFLIYVSAYAPDPQRTMLRLDRAAGRYVPVRFAELANGLAPVPMFALCTRYRVVTDEAAARALLASGAAAPREEPLLYAAPAAALDASATGSIGAVRTDVRDLGVEVRCSGAMLLVIALPIPADFTPPTAGVWIDGEPAAVLSANVLFHAVVVPAGEHDVQLRPRF